MQYLTYYDSPLGKITLAADGESLTGLWIEGQKYFASTLKEEPEINDTLPVFDAAKDWLTRYFLGEKPLISELSLVPAGSPFRRLIWEILKEIPYGSVRTYGDIAAEAALKTGRRTMSAQAIGGAVGHNPISIIIPCHRVIGHNGSLTGYAGGLDKKLRLLTLENALTPQILSQLPPEVL